jgi:hypothetical protein
MRELSIDVSQYGTPEGILENIGYALTLGLPELDKITPPHDGTFVVCGSGPSIESTFPQIRDDQLEGFVVCAVKGAYDFLRGKGITPKYYLSVEPRYRPVKNPSANSTFLLSTRVNLQQFKDLEDYPILMWHSWSIEDPDFDKGKMYIGGGTTSGLRAINVGYVMGFRKFKLYGFDSCLGERGEKRVGQEKLADYVSRTNVIVGDREFQCNMAMAAQAQDFQSLYDVMDDITIEAIGDGLIPAILEERKKRGLRC